MLESIDKKTLWFMSAIVILLFGLLFYYLFGIFSHLSDGLPGIEKLVEEGKITEDILEQFRAPNEEGREVPKDVLEEFKAPSQKGKEIPEDILEGFRSK